MDAPLLLKRVSVDSRAGDGTCSKNSTVNDPSSMKQMIAIRHVPVSWKKVVERIKKLLEG